MNSPARLPAACIALFEAEDLALPPLPAEFAADLQPRGERAFATTHAPQEIDFPGLLAHGLSHPAPTWAWVGLTGHGLQSTAISLALATPHFGFFVRRQWSEAFDQGPTLRRRIEGAFGLLGQAISDAQSLLAQGRWPPGQRLLLVDDDFERQRWGWQAASMQAEDALQFDPMAYLSLLASLDALEAPAPAGR